MTRPAQPSHSAISVWDLLLIPERLRILHLLLESVVYDGTTGKLKLMFYLIGIDSLAA